MTSGERRRLLANVRQRYSFSPDHRGELVVGPSQASLGPSELAPLRRTAENILWLTAAMFAIYYGDSHHHLFHVLFYDPRIRRSPFQLGLLCLAINAVIFAYLSVYLRHILKSEDKWELIAPAAIPIATVVGLTSSLLFSIALWPIWGLLDPPSAVHFVHGVCCDFSLSPTLWIWGLPTLGLGIGVLLVSDTRPVVRRKMC